MKNPHSGIWIFSLAVALTAAMACGFNIRAADSDEQPKVSAAIAKTAEAFVAAFQKGDAKAVAAFWLPAGDFIDLNGRKLIGRTAIENDFTSLFAENKGMQLRIEVESVRLLNPETVVEDGITSVMSPDGASASRARYTNILVLKDGQWLLASVREAPYVAPTNYDHLRPLEWVIGDWATEGGKDEVGRIGFDWSPEGNNILSVHAVTIKDAALSEGTQRITWDPAAKQIRSWTFEADGGFSEGWWTKDGDKWIIRTNSVLRSGSRVTASNVVTRIDADTIIWKTTDQKLDGKPLPDTAEIKMKRVKNIESGN
jgi:uncharacterized protein (TIGR02246 family)